MSNSMGLYDASMIETEAPTDPPTEKPTEKPSETPTDPPTDEPTENPTEEPPTTPSTEKPTGFDPEVQYILGDVDGDGFISILDATTIQMIGVGYIEADEHMLQRAMISDSTQLNIVDATAIQRVLAGYHDTHDIGNVREYNN